ncbi:MAG TPA: EcsC family protein [Dysgonomonas sp.]|uniref:EcsC family protein n=1 Tax=unclassified Dysgonomonas TaxID=2630389 RepID=UPI0025C5D545|nr:MULTISPECIES: EcsC family protein [unclassified Dysgonomonas]HML66484.1 EcsC family protein [Dysgonomonas sp.]
MAKRQNTQVNKGIIAKTLDWAYSKAVSGFTGVDSAYDLGNSYLAQQGSLEAQVDSLIKWQVAKAATSGFVTGLGGVMIMPLTVPANIASVIYVQIRMIAAIAYMGGHDIREDRVKSLIYICMVGNGAKELLKDVSVKAGERLAAKIAEKVSTSIASKTGEKSVTSLGKAVPVLGGLVGGSYDAITTRVVGKVAKKIFIDKQTSEKD